MLPRHGLFHLLGMLSNIGMGRFRMIHGIHDAFTDDRPYLLGKIAQIAAKHDSTKGDGQPGFFLPPPAKVEELNQTIVMERESSLRG